MAYRSSYAAIAKAVHAIMMAKIVHQLHSHPSTENVNHLKDQLEKVFASVHTTAWIGQHGCLPLALSNSNLVRTTNSVITSSNLTIPSQIDKNTKEVTSAL